MQTVEMIQMLVDSETKAIEDVRKKTAASLSRLASKIDFEGEEARLLARLNALYQTACQIEELVPGFRFRPRSHRGWTARARQVGKRGPRPGGIRDGSLVSHVLAVLNGAKQPMDKDSLWAAIKARGFKSKSKDPLNGLAVVLSNLRGKKIGSFKKTPDGSFKLTAGAERGSYYGSL